MLLHLVVWRFFMKVQFISFIYDFHINADKKIVKVIQTQLLPLYVMFNTFPVTSQIHEYSVSEYKICSLFTYKVNQLAKITFKYLATEWATQTST